MNEAIKSSAKYLDKYHNYLPKSRPLSRHDISTLSSHILVSAPPSPSVFSLTDGGSPEPEPGPDSARDKTRVLFHQLAVTSPGSPGPSPDLA